METGLVSARRRLQGAAAVIALGALSAGAAQAADAAVGKAKAQACVVCHGQQGISNVPDAPNLAGQPALYVAAQLKAFRGGERKHEVMNLMAKPLTDGDIDNLAAWYASIRIDARAP